MKALYITITAGILFTSCIPNKNLLYLKSDNFSDSTYVENKVVDYKLRSGDILMIELKGLDPNIAPLFNAIGSSTQGQTGNVNLASLALQGNAIDKNGNISLPMMGEISIKDLTLTEANQSIQAKVDDFFINALVKVNLVNFRVTVLGEVNNPGLYYNYNDRISILEALGMAGDLTEFGDRTNIKLLRRVENGEKVAHLDLGNENILNSKYFYLMPGDVIYVQPMKEGTQRFNLPAFSIILSSITTIFVVLRFFAI